MPQINQKQEKLVGKKFQSLSTSLNASYIKFQYNNFIIINIEQMTKNQKISKEKDPSYDPKDIENAQKASRKKTRKFNSSAWSIDQQRLYVEFLKANQQIFEEEKQRRKHNIFVKFSKHMGRRSADQCRSHHQKMMIKFGSMQEAIERLLKQKVINTEKNQQVIDSKEYEICCQKKQNQITDFILRLGQKQQISHSVSEIQIRQIDEEDLDIWGCIDNEMWIEQSSIQFL